MIDEHPFDEHPFDCFFKSVQDLWPRCKMSRDQIKVHWRNVLVHHSASVVSAALTKCVSDYPDDTAPKWKVIFGYLVGRAERTGTGKSDFQSLLDQTRRAMKKPWGPQGIMRKGVDQMTDEDVWLEWVGAQCHERYLREHPDTERCTTCVRTSHGECGLGHRECLSKRNRNHEYARWRNYIEERGDVVPAYLVD
ncbi:hypothetical protein LCGC14_1255900 [marine sediment metagenome]|uniref:Uncharacterized protein n=1 Tax=marine sediment metagenome TaxID=412755 RepID=A0A0F9L227_9ZZZZ